MAHSPKAYADLGRLVAGAQAMPRVQLRDRYESAFMGALREMATTKRHSNVLQHIVGYFSKKLDVDSRGELHALIQDYRAGLVPLVVPLTLLRHYVRQLDVTYLRGQVYLEPHPKELMLRNHV
jgi:uncharacterized protein YbgA (DUF1722 family)